MKEMGFPLRIDFAVADLPSQGLCNIHPSHLAGTGNVCIRGRKIRSIVPGLFLSFLKIGAVVFSSRYVLLSFPRSEFVDRLPWLTEKQLIDSVAVGPCTPRPGIHYYVHWLLVAGARVTTVITKILAAEAAKNTPSALEISEC